jgi:hypothetical protein
VDGDSDLVENLVQTTDKRVDQTRTSHRSVGAAAGTQDDWGVNHLSSDSPDRRRGGKVSDSLVVDVAIGLVFTFAVLAALTSALTEAVSRYLGLRGDYLLQGLRALVDGDNTPAVETATVHEAAAGKLASAAQPVALWGTGGGVQAVAVDGSEQSIGALSSLLLRNALLGNQGVKRALPAADVKLTRAMKRDLPSYISGRSFSSAVLALLVPDLTGTTTMATITTEIDKLPGGVLKKSLQSLAASSAGDINRFRASVESWYDDHMARVSGWYKRHVRWISLAIGLVLVVVANVSALALSRSLYTDQAVRESVVTQAVSSSNCASSDASTCIQQARDAIDKLHAGGLPVGWAKVAECQSRKPACNFWQRYGLTSTSKGIVHPLLATLVLLAGWALTAFALTPGARFWFDILSKLGTLRSTGPKPATT